jgi:primosomal protein N' (replication factor Y)
LIKNGGKILIAEIIINSNVKNLNKKFDYIIPEELEEKVFVGSRVFVPFGNKKKFEEGFVVGIKETSEYIEKLKEIAKVEEIPGINEEKLELAKYMSHRYFCNVSDCIKQMLPPGTTTKVVENRINDKMQNFVYLAKEVDEIEEDIENKIIKSEKQIRALKFLIEDQNNGVLSTELQAFADVSSAILKTLEKNGYIEIVEKAVERNPFIHKVVETTQNLELTEEQQEALEKVKASMEFNEYEEFLLFGVTGSGKTEVYIRLIEENLKLNKTSIMLVPEISLTPQTVDRFLGRFGEEKIAVLHSKLSVGERYDQWKKIEQGKAKIVIGARSAIFAPVKDLGLIIIDEEHDSSYKSENAPRYNAKEIATYLAQKGNFPIVLGSATPDMSTYTKAINGEIQYLELTKRANNSSLPEVEIVDLRQELAAGNKTMISGKLYNAIKENLKNKKQTILFLNRRGFSTFIMCRDCGYTAKCKNCNITLTYHLKQNKLKCHYCGYEVPALKVCPECNSQNIRYFGTGTQKLEEQIKNIFPEASTIRMDIDTVSKKNSHEDILNAFKNENIDILIGTQMIVKGHHFPNVTLVGVIAADSSLNIDDYRAHERTFQILTQVAGRAGREKEKGKVIIQTYNPDNFAIQYAQKQDYKLFYDMEVILRKQLRYPPFCDIMLLEISSKNQKELENLSKNIYEDIKQKIKTNNLPIILYKPVPSPIDRIKNRIRWRIIIKCKIDEKIINEITDTVQKANQTIKNSKNATRLIVDVNPTSML